jgi:hypothetical protein
VHVYPCPLRSSVWWLLALWALLKLLELKLGHVDERPSEGPFVAVLALVRMARVHRRAVIMALVRAIGDGSVTRRVQASRGKWMSCEFLEKKLHEVQTILCVISKVSCNIWIKCQILPHKRSKPGVGDRFPFRLIVVAYEALDETAVASARWLTDHTLITQKTSLSLKCNLIF